MMKTAPVMHQALQEYRVPAAGESIAGADGPDQLKACMRFIDGKPTADDVAWIGRGIAAFLGDMGSIPLERCLRLPTTHNALRKLRRDEWLRKAASLLDVDGSWIGAQKLETEWNKFIDRGPWQHWRDDESPPPHSSALNEALFYATRLNRSQALGVKHLSRIVGDTFSPRKVGEPQR
ncbi:MAG: hypothetical protein Q8R69_07775 [Telluria sp.]|nr:hypothetical protein [Telluria sp.]